MDQRGPRWSWQFPPTVAVQGIHILHDWARVYTSDFASHFENTFLRGFGCKWNYFEIAAECALSVNLAYTRASALYGCSYKTNQPISDWYDFSSVNFTTRERYKYGNYIYHIHGVLIV